MTRLSDAPIFPLNVVPSMFISLSLPSPSLLLLLYSLSIYFSFSFCLFHTSGYGALAAARDSNYVYLYSIDKVATYTTATYLARVPLASAGTLSAV